MGRHSSPEQGPFYRSVVMWFLPWLVIAVVAVAAVWLGIGTLAGDGADQRPVSANDESEPSPRPTESPSEEPSPTPEQSPSPKPKPSKSPKPDAPKLITEGITIQVLNATATPGAEDAIAARLQGLGFTIVATEGASVQYPRTTVFWAVPEAQEAAEALAARLGWEAAQKPENLSDTVSLHVVVGADEV